MHQIKGSQTSRSVGKAERNEMSAPRCMKPSVRMRSSTEFALDAYCTQACGG